MFVNTNSTVAKTNKYGMRGLYVKRSIGGDKLQASRMSIAHAPTLMIPALALP